MDYRIRTLEQLRPILLAFRKQAGLSQTEVASLLGVSQQSYAKIEANPTATSVERLFKILGLLGADIILNYRPEHGAGGDAPAVLAEHGLELASATSPRSGADAPSKKNNGKATPAPAKLIPPSKKTENW